MMLYLKYILTSFLDILQFIFQKIKFICHQFIIHLSFKRNQPRIHFLLQLKHVIRNYHLNFLFLYYFSVNKFLQ